MWIKICGVRDVETARAAAESGANAIGLNFYANSPRQVDERTAAAIVKVLPEDVAAVGVFVNHTAAQIRQICESCGIRTAQLHGDEPVSVMGELKGIQIIRALRTTGDITALATSELAAYAVHEESPWAWLVDARVPHVYGGSGETVDWESLAAVPRTPDWPPLILAGGLTPENVAQAVRIVRPWGVDVAGGVESAPGVKNPTLVRQFVRRIRDAS
ncbi:MAG: N-(5'-phosphoribosyl)anthranilate isomerase [Planctomycetaceae bacterium]